MKILKICAGEWDNESRDRRELSVYREMGAEVEVLTKGLEGDRGRVDDVYGFKVLRYTTRPYVKFPVMLNRLLSIFQWARYVSVLNAEVISGHDIGGWTIGWLATVINRKYKPQFIYDSHEFELGRNVKRNKFQKALIRFWEKRVIEKSAFTIVVNDSIADELVRIYKLDKRPIVVRNIPNKWDVDKSVCSKVRDELETALGEGYYVLYHGLICKNRGLEQLISATRDMKDVKLLIIGKFESDSYKAIIDSFIEKSNNVMVKSAVPHEELWQYIGAVDLCIAPIIPKCRSYYFALPNKLFEAIQAGTPLLVSDLPEMRKIVDKYGVGEFVNSEDEKELAAKIEYMKNRGQTPYLAGIETAREELIWEREREVLKSAYAQFVKQI